MAYLVSRVSVPRIPCLNTSYPVFAYPVSRAERTPYPVPWSGSKVTLVLDVVVGSGVPRIPCSPALLLHHLFRGLGWSPLLLDGFLDNVACLSWRWAWVDGDCAFSNLVALDEADGF